MDDTMDLGHIEDNARQMFINQQHDELEAAWQNIPSGQEANYPNLAYEIGRICANRGSYSQARIALSCARSGYAERREILGAVRVMLIFAHISKFEGMIAPMLNILDEAQTLIPKIPLPTDVLDLSYAPRRAQKLILEGNIHYLRGDAFYAVKPNDAMPHFLKARSLLIEAQGYDPLAVRTDLILVTQRLADISGKTHMYQNAHRFQSEAIFQAEHLGDVFWLTFVYLQASSLAERSGDYEQARQFFQKCHAFPLTDTYSAELRWREAWLAWLVGDDATSRELLTEKLITPNAHALGMLHLVRAYILVSQREHLKAYYQLQEAIAFAGENETLINRCIICEALISALTDTVSLPLLRRIEDTARFFDESGQSIEASQAFLMAIWLAGILNEDDSAATADCIRNTQKIGHANHLTRFYVMGYPLLFDVFRQATDGDKVLGYIDRFQKQYLFKTGVTVLALGYPQVSVNRTRLVGDKQIWLMLFMLEQRNHQANRDSIGAELWPTLEGRKVSVNLGVLKNSMADLIGDWLVYEHGTHRIKPGFPAYYDAHVFQEFIARAKHYQHEHHRLNALVKAIRLYRGDFVDSPKIYSEFLFGRRAHYADLYIQALEEAMKLATILQKPETFEELHYRLNSYAN